MLTADGDFVDAIPGSQGIIIPNLDGVRAIRILGEVPQNEITTEVDNGNHDPQQISGDEESPLTKGLVQGKGDATEDPPPRQVGNA